MAKKVRNEDLNPSTDEITEKVRQMMDPSVPDKDTPPKALPKKEATPKTSKVNIVKLDEDDKPAETAPEITNNKPISLNGRKVIIPISQSEKSDESEDSNLRPPIKIDVSNEDETPQEVAEKLDEAIAGLSKKSLDKSKKTKKVETLGDLPKSDDKKSKVNVNEEDVELNNEISDEEKTFDSVGDITEDEAVLLEADEVVESPETDEAVKDIVAKESDQLLDIADAIKEDDTEKIAKKPKHKFSFKNFITNKNTIKVLLILFVLSLIGLALYPTTRYGILNLAGVRSSSNIIVLDNSTSLPLKNVSVTIGSVSTKTDIEGKANFNQIKLGKSKLKIERIAFATQEKDIVVGWGSNPLGSYKIIPTGAQYKFELTDFLSGKPIKEATALSEESSAIGDDKGVITLTIPSTDLTEIEVKIIADDYRAEILKISLSTKETTKVSMVSGKKHIYVTKKSGKYDIHGVYADGKDDKLILAGSGNEKEDLALVPHQTQNITAYVSTRAGKKNKDGFVLSDLVLLDNNNGKTTPVSTAERIQILGWIDDKIVFVTIASGESTASPNRNKLLSFSKSDNKIIEIAKSNYFNDLLIVRGNIYFAPSSAVAGGTPAQFYRVNADGSNMKSLLNQEVWNINRTSFDSLALSVGQKWFSFTVGEDSVKKLDNPPTATKGRIYITSPNGKKSIWVDHRDGKGTLITYDTESKTEAVLLALGGLKLPMYWLDNNTVVYRFESKTETADYVISINGGNALKIRDVTKTSGIDNWYYY